MQPDPHDREDAPTVAALRDRRGGATGENAGDPGSAGAPAEPPDLYTGGPQRFYANLGDA